MVEIRKHVVLANYTSWKVGGAAEQFFQPKNIEELAEYLKQLPCCTPVTWLGLGSNILVRDAGVKGVVIAVFPALNSLGIQNGYLIAQAGVACAQVARFSARHELAGLEFLAGIPGSVGGALAMNAGCHGAETWDMLRRVEMINRQGRRFYRLHDEFSAGYREVNVPQDEWFLSAEFALAPGDKAESLQIIRELLDRRSATQPTSFPSCGSVFRNPPGDYAARLIEAAGLKGFSIGDAQVSLKHANFILNTGKASAADIEGLIEYIEKTVLEYSGVILQREVRIVGER